MATTCKVAMKERDVFGVGLNDKLNNLFYYEIPLILPFNSAHHKSNV